MTKKAKKDDRLTLLQKVESICLMEGCPEPDEFLAAVMTGKDMTRPQQVNGCNYVTS
jgi:hypothetical protein